MKTESQIRNIKIIGILLLLPYNIYVINLVLRFAPFLMQDPNLFFSTSVISVDSTYLLITSNALGFCLLILSFFLNSIPKKRPSMKKRRQTKEELELSEKMRLALERE
jgi:hypothetical protein